MDNQKHPFSLTPVELPPVETKHRRIQAALPVPESLEILDRIHKYESSNVKDQLPVIWDTAKGYQIFDKWGNAWIDFTSTIFVANTGHGHPHLVEAIKPTSCCTPTATQPKSGRVTWRS